MKKKNNSGFTLIELLAVIVVLAIVVALAAGAVFPQLAQARKNTFAIEANNAIDSAQTYYMNGSLTGADVYATLPVAEGGTRCVTIDTLRTSGDFDADDSYSGYIIVTKKGNIYEYNIWMTNKKLQVTGAGGDDSVDASEVADYTENAVSATCPTSSTSE